MFHIYLFLIDEPSHACNIHWFRLKLLGLCRYRTSVFRRRLFYTSFHFYRFAISFNSHPRVNSSIASPWMIVYVSILPFFAFSLSKHLSQKKSAHIHYSLSQLVGAWKCGNNFPNAFLKKFSFRPFWPKTIQNLPFWPKMPKIEVFRIFLESDQSLEFAFIYLVTGV